MYKSITNGVVINNKIHQVSSLPPGAESRTSAVESEPVRVSGLGPLSTEKGKISYIKKWESTW